jgi:hypothetical protein
MREKVMITDIRAVNFWDWSDNSATKEWVIVRHEIQIRREGCDWVPINVFDRDNQEIDIDPPEVSDHYQEYK